MSIWLKMYCTNISRHLPRSIVVQSFKKCLYLQLPSRVPDSEIVKLARLFSPSTLETLTVEQFGVLQAEIDTFKAECREDKDGFKRKIFYHFRNTGHTRKVISFYRNKIVCIFIAIKVLFCFSYTYSVQQDVIQIQIERG